MTTSRLLKVPEVGIRLGLSRGKVYQLIAEKRLKILKIDRSTRITEEAIAEFIEGIDGVENNNL